MANIPTLYYFDCKGRAEVPALIMAAAGMPLVIKLAGKDFDWSTIKSKTPFGQLPLLVHGNITIAQSSAITRYLAKISQLQGGTDAEFARSEMMLSEAEDIYNVIAKAKAEDTIAAWDKCVTVSLPAHVVHLEKLLDTSPYFVGNSVLAGDISIFASLSMMMDLGGDPLKLAPKLSAFYARMKGLDCFKAHIARTQNLFYVRKMAAPPLAKVEPVQEHSEQTSAMPTTDYGPGINGRRIIQAPGGTSTLQFFG